MGLIFNNNSFRNLISTLDLTQVPNSFNLKAMMSEACKSWQTYIYGKAEAANAFIQGLTLFSEFYSSDFLTGGDAFPNPRYFNWVELATEYGLLDAASGDAQFWNEFVNAFLSLADSASKVMTVTDASGNVYSLKFIDQSTVVKIVCQYGENLSHQIDLWSYNYFEKLVGVNEIVTNIKGAAACVWDVLRDLSISSQINDVISHVIDAILSKQPQVAINGLLSKFSSYGETCREIIYNANTALAAGGKLRAMQYMLSYMNALRTAGSDENSVFFTSNVSLIPQQYLAGFINLALTTASAVASALVLTGSKILGAVGVILSSAFNFVSSYIEQDWQSTKCFFRNDDDVQLNGAPIGVFQSEWLLTPENWALVPVAIQEGACFVFRVPGGYLAMAGKADGTRKILTEFHSDLLNRAFLFDYWNDQFPLFEHYFSANKGGTILHSNSWRAKTLVGQSYSEYFSSQDSDQDLCNSVGEVTVEGGYDYKMYRLICVNTLIFLNSFIDLLDDDWKIQCFDEGDTSHLYPNPTIITAPSEATATDIALANTYAILAYIIFDTDSSWLMNWASMIEYLNWTNNLNAAPVSFVINSLPAIVLQGGCYGAAEGFDYPAEIQWLLKIPELSAASMLTTIVSASVITITAIAVATIISIKVSRAIQKKRLKNSIAVYKAQEAMMNDPSEQNIAAYRAAVTRNNLWANVIGGVKYSKADYWFGSGSSAVTGTNDGPSTWIETFDKFNKSLMYPNEASSSDQALNHLINTTDPLISSSTGAIFKKITGEDPS